MSFAEHMTSLQLSRPRLHAAMCITGNVGLGLISVVGFILIDRGWQYTGMALAFEGAWFLGSLNAKPWWHPAPGAAP